jgi:hypothetical protein
MVRAFPAKGLRPVSRSAGAMQAMAHLLHCKNVMNYSELTLFIDNFLDRDSMRTYLNVAADAVVTA